MKFIYFLLAVLIVAGCNSPQKLINTGQYDAAVNKTVKKLRRNKTKQKQIKWLETAYRKALQRDDEQIKSLKQNGQPDCWDDIFYVYSQMKRRQEMVKPLLPLFNQTTGKPAQFEIRDYDKELISSKEKAAEYFYVHAKSLLEKNNKYDARKAYDELNTVLTFYAEYKDVNTLKIKAHEQGMTYVLMGVTNNTNTIMPKRLEEDLLKLPLGDLNSFWVQYHNKSVPNTNYDYTIRINMKNIFVTPEQISDNNYTESKEIEDGWQYVYDVKGNVKKDSLGNDIKAPKYVNAVAQVKEVHQFKKANISGTLDFYNNYNNQLLKSEPIMAENIFEYHTATAAGDLRALKPETKAKLGAPPKMFPINADMVYNAGLTLKGMCKDIVYNNRGIIN